MDATKNDAAPAYKARSFPTLHFFPAGADKKGIAYTGGRTKEAIVQFIAQHATHKFDAAAVLAAAPAEGSSKDVKDEL